VKEDEFFFEVVMVSEGVQPRERNEGVYIKF
jgi:hypothetical protein